jgi:hypothetical protein
MERQGQQEFKVMLARLAQLESLVDKVLQAQQVLLVLQVAQERLD